MGGPGGRRRRPGPGGPRSSTLRQALSRADPARVRRGRARRRRAEHGGGRPRAVGAAGRAGPRARRAARAPRDPRCPFRGHALLASRARDRHRARGDLAPERCRPRAGDRSRVRAGAGPRGARHRGGAQPARLPVGARRGAGDRRRDPGAAARARGVGDRDRRGCREGRPRGDRGERCMSAVPGADRSRGGASTLAVARPGAHRRRGHASDRRGRRRDQLHDARARAAVARLRPGASGGPRDRRAARDRRGALAHPRRRRSHAHRRRPADLRCRRSDRARGRDGRPNVRSDRRDTGCPARERDLHAGRDPPDGASSRSAFGGVAPVRARHRPGGARTGGCAVRAAHDKLGRWIGGPRRHRSGLAGEPTLGVDAAGACGRVARLSRRAEGRRRGVRHARA